jgi:hypothetical protein
VLGEAAELTHREPSACRPRGVGHACARSLSGLPFDAGTTEHIDPRGGAPCQTSRRRGSYSHASEETHSAPASEAERPTYGSPRQADMWLVLVRTVVPRVSLPLLRRSAPIEEPREPCDAEDLPERRLGDDRGRAEVGERVQPEDVAQALLPPLVDGARDREPRPLLLPRRADRGARDGGEARESTGAASMRSAPAPVTPGPSPRVLSRPPHPGAALGGGRAPPEGKNRQERSTIRTNDH